MMHRRPTSPSPAQHIRVLPNFHDWVLSLPWVVERPYDVGAPRVRTFAVDCELLARRRLWLVSDLRQSRRLDDADIAVIVPFEVAQHIELVGWGRSLSPMPEGHVLVGVSDSAISRPPELEALVLTAYSYAMSED